MARGCAQFDVAEAVRLYEQGMGGTQIAARLGAGSRSTVMRALREAGVKTKRPGQQPNPLATAENLTRWFHVEGKTASEVAGLLGCSRQNVFVCMKKMRVLRPRTGMGAIANLTPSFSGYRTTDWESLGRASPGKHEYRCPDCLTKRYFACAAHARVAACKVCHPFRGGYGELSGSYWSQVELKALSRGIPFSVTAEKAWQLVLDQKRLCNMCGILFVMPRMKLPTEGVRGEDWEVGSFDRIISADKAPYSAANCQWLCVECQLAKMARTDERVVRHCRRVVAHQDRKAAA